MDKNKSQSSHNKKLVIGKKILVESENDNLDSIINSKIKLYKNELDDIIKYILMHDSVKYNYSADPKYKK